MMKLTLQNILAPVTCSSVNNTSARTATSIRKILPTVWEANEWKAELFRGSSGHEEKSRTTDLKPVNHPKNQPELSLEPFDPNPTVIYSIAVVERLARMPRRTILRCCRCGLVSPISEPELGGYYFNREAIRILQRIGYLQSTCGVNFAGIKFVLELTREIQRLRAALVEPACAPQFSKSGERN